MCVPRFRRENETSCQELINRRTQIPSQHSYIHLTCRESTNSTKIVYEEYFHIVAPGKKSKINVNKENRSLNPSVLVIGLDTQSRMNFMRHMPKSHVFLTKNLSAIDMKGFNKVGDSTFNNTLGFLMGMDFTETREKCWESLKDLFDACTFVCKRFAELGYATSFSEEVNGVFNYRFEGFKSQPTDYYLHPFQHDIDLQRNYSSGYVNVYFNDFQLLARCLSIFFY